MQFFSDLEFAPAEAQRKRTGSSGVRIAKSSVSFAETAQRQIFAEHFCQSNLPNFSTTANMAHGEGERDSRFTYLFRGSCSDI